MKRILDTLEKSLAVGIFPGQLLSGWLGLLFFASLALTAKLER